VIGDPIILPDTSNEHITAHETLNAPTDASSLPSAALPDATYLIPSLQKKRERESHYPRNTSQLVLSLSPSCLLHVSMTAHAKSFSSSLSWSCAKTHELHCTVVNKTETLICNFRKLQSPWRKTNNKNRNYFFIIPPSQREEFEKKITWSLLNQATCSKFLQTRYPDTDQTLNLKTLFFLFLFFPFFRQRRENHHGQLPMQTQWLSEIIPGKWKKTNTRGKKKNQTTERTRARQRRQTRQRREEKKSLHRGQIGRRERRTPGPVITGNPRRAHHIVDKYYRSQAVALRVPRFIYEDNRRIRSSTTFNYIGNSMFIQIIMYSKHSGLDE
jgi:hypothetical protein